LVLAALVGIVFARAFTPRTALAQTSNTVAADYFRLVDSRGEHRASIGMSGENEEYTFLYLMDSSGKTRMEITVYPDSRIPQIKLLDQKGKTVATLFRKTSYKPLSKTRITVRSKKNGPHSDKADDVTVSQLRDVVNNLDALILRVNELSEHH